MKKEAIWKYNKRSGMWDHQRGVEHDTKDQWMSIYKKDEPDSHFHVSSKKPKHNPTVKENLAGAGTSGDGGMSAPFSAIGQEIDARRKQKPIPLGKTMGSYIDEEGEGGAPVNNAGSGNIAGFGGKSGEPGRSPELMPMARRGKKFMGIEPYLVKTEAFNKIRDAKRKGKHWRTYLDEDESYVHIRNEAKKNKHGAIIIEDEITGAMCFVKYGKKK